MYKLHFKTAQEVKYFFDRVQMLIAKEQEVKGKKEKAQLLLAYHVLYNFKLKHQRLIDFPQPKKITIDTQTNLAIFILAENEPDFYFSKLRNYADQNFLLN
jgi:hypothetical protein